MAECFDLVVGETVPLPEPCTHLVVLNDATLAGKGALSSFYRLCCTAALLHCCCCCTAAATVAGMAAVVSHWLHAIV